MRETQTGTLKVMPLETLRKARREGRTSTSCLDLEDRPTRPTLNCRSNFRDLADRSLHPSFTHHESPAFVAVFLNLYNSSFLAHPASEVPPLDHRVDDRAWLTSHLISFLGHVSLERFKCNGKEADSTPHGIDDVDRPKPASNSFVRAVVHGKAEVMAGCEDGPEGSCKWPTFRKFVDDRVER